MDAGLIWALAWVGVAAVWLGLMPVGTRGRSWHLAQASIPLIAAGAYAVAPADLREILRLWAWGGVGALGLLLATWALGGLRRNHGLMDVAYPMIPLAVAGFAVVSSWPRFSVGGGIALGLLAVWSARLAAQTYGQNHRVEREPYATWRARHGPIWWWWSLFQVYLLQGVMIWLWSLGPVFAVTAPWNPVTATLGGIVWAVGFLFQAGGDAQLTRFRRDPANRGAILQSGFWRIVRQPNYFGEAVMWWGYFIFGLAHPWGAAAVVAPLYATWFMGFGSAGPYKERHMQRTRGAAWEAYCMRTPRFFPWPRPGPAKRAS